jgi:hypothetical protein
MAVEVHDLVNRGRMLTSAVLLVAYGFVVDRLDAGGWLSGWIEDPD